MKKGSSSDRTSQHWRAYGTTSVLRNIYQILINYLVMTDITFEFNFGDKAWYKDNYGAKNDLKSS